MHYLRTRPISHVPVAVCRSVGIRTRGRTAASGRIGFPNPWTDSQRRNWRTPPVAGDAAQSNDGAGFFGLCRSSKDRRGYRRGLSFFAERADRAFPFASMAFRSEESARSHRVSIARCGSLSS